MKKSLGLLCVLWCCVCINAVAGVNFYQSPAEHLPYPTPHFSGFYLAGQAGWANLNYTTTTLGVPVLPGFLSSSLRKDGLAGRISGGYLFAPYFATEVGFSYFTPPKLTLKTPVGTISEDFQQQAIDVDAVLQYPFDNGLVPYIKGGGAYVMRRDLSLSVAGFRFTAPVSSDKFRPLAGAGIGFQYDQNWRIFIDYYHIFGTGRSLGGLPGIDFVSAGVMYKFVII